MNKLLELLTGGDLRSDGNSIQVAEMVIENPKLIKKLIDGLSVSNELVRARTSGALEYVSRFIPVKVKKYLPLILNSTIEEKNHTAKFHLAMLLANLDISENESKNIFEILFNLLDDESFFVKIWAISSLTILSLKHQNYIYEVLKHLDDMEEIRSKAIKARIRISKRTLIDGKKLPKSWIKSL